MAAVVLNLILSFYPILKVDLTKERIHSLSAATIKIIKNLDDVVKIKVYVTSDLPPEIRPVASDLKTVLESLAALNRRKLQVNYFDPNKSEEIKQEAENLGIKALQFSSVKADKFEVQSGYFGLAMFYGDKNEVLPVAGDVGNLEYFIISGVKKLTGKEIPAVAIAELSGNQQTELQFLRKYLGNDYEVREVFLNGEDDLPSAESLVLVGGKERLNDNGLSRLREWVKQGKGLIALIDKVDVDEMMTAKNNDIAGLESVLREQGVEIKDGLVTDESAGIANFRTQNGSFLTQYVYWPSIRPENIDAEVPAMSGISSLMLAWASPMAVSGEAKPLFSSSQFSAVKDSLNDLSPVNVKKMEKYDGKQVMAAINTNGVKMAVIGDADLIKDQFVSNNQQNLLMVLNLVDYFSQDDSLLSIRSKNLRNVPLLPVSDEIKTIVKIGNMVLPLVLLAIILILGNFFRKKQNEKWIQR